MLDKLSEEPDSYAKKSKKIHRLQLMPKGDFAINVFLWMILL